MNIWLSLYISLPSAGTDDQCSNLEAKYLIAICISCSSVFYLLGILTFLLPKIIKRFCSSEPKTQEKELTCPLYEDIGQGLKSEQPSHSFKMDDNSAYGQQH